MYLHSNITFVRALFPLIQILSRNCCDLADYRLGYTLRTCWKGL